MGRQLRVVHRTGYRYRGLISASHNEARMTPRATREQFVLATRLDITPVAWSHSFIDYWGTPVTAFEIAEPHSRLDVVATSTVDVGDRLSVGPGVSWADLADPKLCDQQVEYLGITDHVDPGNELRKIAQEAAKHADRPVDAAHAIIRSILDKVAYVPGSTEVSTRATAVWEAGAGVCQDLVHLGLGALRTMGIPARYVSGYVMPSANPMVGEALAKYLRLRKVHPHAADPALWIGPKGALSGNGVLQMFRRRGAAIGQPMLHPHGRPAPGAQGSTAPPRTVDAPSKASG